jgi:hypothetical protein
VQCFKPMGSDYQVSCFNHPAAVGRGIGTKSCCIVESKVPFSFDRFRPNWLSLLTTGRECMMFCYLSPMRGEIGKTLSACRVKCPSLWTDFDQTCSASRACVWSCRCDVSVIPLQCEGSYGRKTVTSSSVKCPSLLSDFDQTCTVCTARSGSARCPVSVNPLQCDARKGRKDISVSRVKCPSLLTDFDQTCCACRE